MDLRDILPLNGQQPGGQPGMQGGAPSMPPGAGNPVTGIISRLGANGEGGGLKKVAASVTAVVVKILEALVVAYGTASEEGKKITAAIRSLLPIIQGVQTGDLASTIQSLIAMLPANMKQISPNSVADMLTNKGAPQNPQGGGMPPGAGGMPPGAGGGMPPGHQMPQGRPMPQGLINMLHK